MELSSSFAPSPRSTEIMSSTCCFVETVTDMVFIAGYRDRGKLGPEPPVSHEAAHLWRRFWTTLRAARGRNSESRNPVAESRGLGSCFNRLRTFCHRQRMSLRTRRSDGGSSRIYSFPSRSFPYRPHALQLE